MEDFASFEKIVLSKLNRKYDEKVIKKTLQMMKGVTAIIARKGMAYSDNPLLEVKTKAVLLSFPKFVWNFLEKIKDMPALNEQSEVVNGYEMYITMIIYICTSQYKGGFLDLFAGITEVIEKINTGEAKN